MRVARTAALLLGAMLSVGSAQIIASGSVAVPSHLHGTRFDDLQALGRVGIALPPVSHAVAFWNIAGLSFDRLAQHNGAGLETGLEAWVSPAQRVAQSRAPLLLAEAAAGRRWGFGLHGYTTLGAGVGWSLGDWVPYVEIRRRASFHAGRPVAHELVVGLHFVLFG